MTNSDFDLAGLPPSLRPELPSFEQRLLETIAAQRIMPLVLAMDESVVDFRGEPKLSGLANRSRFNFIRKTAKRLEADGFISSITCNTETNLFTHGIATWYGPATFGFNDRDLRQLLTLANGDGDGGKPLYVVCRNHKTVEQLTLPQRRQLDLTEMQAKHAFERFKLCCAKASDSELASQTPPFELPTKLLHGLFETLNKLTGPGSTRFGVLKAISEASWMVLLRLPLKVSEMSNSDSLDGQISTLETKITRFRGTTLCNVPPSVLSDENSQGPSSYLLYCSSD